MVATQASEVTKSAKKGVSREARRTASINNDTLFSELFSYYRDMENRRWQYFAGLLIVDGLLLNAWSGLSNPVVPSISMLLCIGAIFVGIAFLRLLSRSRRRINEIAAELNTLVNRPLMNVGGLGFWGLGGITMWLYLSAIVLTLPWFFTLWTLNPIITILAVLIFIGSLTAIEWSLTKEASAK